MRDNESGELSLLDDIGHSESFARTGDPQKNLFVDTRVEIGDQLIDGLRLIPSGFKISLKLKRHKCILSVVWVLFG